MEIAYRKLLFFLAITIASLLVISVGPSAHASVLQKAPNNLGLAGYWPMEDGAGTIATDHSGNNNIGTLTNMETTDWTTGKVGRALDFDGSNEYVTAGDIDVLDTATTLTGCSWVKHNTLTGDDEIISKEAGGNDGVRLFRDDVGAGSGRTDTYHIHIRDSADTDAAFVEGATNASTASTWTHVCFTFTASSATGLRLYINGVEDANSPASVSTIAAINAGTAAFTIGLNSDLATAPYDGQIDEVRFYSRALSATEVTALYNQSKITHSNASQNSVLTKGLIGLWSFDGADTSTTTATDRSGNGNNGTLTPTWTASSTLYNASTTWAVPTGVNLVKVEAWGGGGGGGVIGGNGGGGGAGGAYAQSLIEVGQGISYPLTIGGGGAPDVAAGGGATTFGFSLVVAAGGPGTTGATGATAAASSSSLGDFIRRGGSGGTGANSGDLGGGGGGAAGPDGNGGTGAAGGVPTGGSGGDGRAGDNTHGGAGGAGGNNNPGQDGTSDPLGGGGGGGGDDTYAGGTGGVPGGGGGGGETTTNNNADGGVGQIKLSYDIPDGPQPVTGKIGQALEFDGTDDYIDAGDIAAIDTATALSGCAWVKHDAVTTDDHIFSKVAPADADGFRLWRDDVGAASGRTDIYKIYVADSTDTSNLSIESATNASSLNTWTHVCFTFQAATATNGLRLYVNGVEDANSPVSSANIAAIDAGTNPFTIGVNSDLVTSELDGQIDDVRVYSRVLSASEVALLHRSSSVTRNASLIGSPGLGNFVLWQTFDGSTVSNGHFVDRSGQGNTGYPTNIATTTFYAIGKIGQGLNFDGTDDYIDAGDIAAIDTATALSGCAWVKHDTITGDDMIMSKYVAATNDGFYFWRDDVGLTSSRADIYSIQILDSADSGAVRLEGAANTSVVGSWTHVCFTAALGSSTGLRLYVNGVEDSISAATPGNLSSIAAIDAGADPFMVGKYSSGLNLDGQIDDVRVYSRVLTADEILKLYNQGN